MFNNHLLGYDTTEFTDMKFNESKNYPSIETAFTVCIGLNMKNKSPVVNGLDMQAPNS